MNVECFSLIFVSYILSVDFVKITVCIVEQPSLPHNIISQFHITEIIFEIVVSMYTVYCCYHPALQY